MVEDLRLDVALQGTAHGAAMSSRAQDVWARYLLSVDSGEAVRGRQWQQLRVHHAQILKTGYGEGCAAFQDGAHRWQ